MQTNNIPRIETYLTEYTVKWVDHDLLTQGFTDTEILDALHRGSIVIAHKCTTKRYLIKV